MFHVEQAKGRRSFLVPGQQRCSTWNQPSVREHSCWPVNHVVPRGTHLEPPGL